jgi:hypothetical protein
VDNGRILFCCESEKIAMNSKFNRIIMCEV